MNEAEIARKMSRNRERCREVTTIKAFLWTLCPPLYFLCIFGFSSAPSLFYTVMMNEINKLVKAFWLWPAAVM